MHNNYVMDIYFQVFPRVQPIKIYSTKCCRDFEIHVFIKAGIWIANLNQFLLNNTLNIIWLRCAL